MRFWINQEPADNGLLGVYSPHNIFMVQDLAYDKHRKFRFRSYVESHEYRKIKNEMEEQTFSGICLCPTGNFPGKYQIFPLKTGCLITINQEI